MAELLGIITGTIAVVETAGKVGSRIVKLKRLWDQVKDVPRSIKALMDELERYKPLVDGLEADFAGIRHIISNDQLAKASTEYCRQAMGSLEALIQDFQQEIEPKKRFRRGVAKVKVVLKSDVISKYREQMQSALQLVSLAQQSYLIALTRLQPSMIAAQINSCTHHITETDEEVQDASGSEVVVRKQETASGRQMTSLPWMGRTWQQDFFGEFAWDATDVISDYSRQMKTRVYRSRLQLPSWVAPKVWDFYFAKSSGQWTTCLRSYAVRPRDADIFKYVRAGDLSRVREELKSKRASLHDRSPNGDTLLHFAVDGGHSAMVKALVQMGVELYEVNNLGLGAVDLAALWRFDPGVYTLTRYGAAQCLITHYDVDDLEDFLEGAILAPRSQQFLVQDLRRYVWVYPKFFDVVAGEFRQAPVTQRYRTIDWKYVQPDHLLEVLRHDNEIDSVTFRAQLNGVAGSIQRFAATYFEISREWILAFENVSHIFENWRELTRWVYKGICVADLCKDQHGYEHRTAIESGLRLKRLYSGPVNSPREAKAWQRALDQACVLWVEDMESVGVDLLQYGRMESKAWMRNSELHSERWDQFHSCGYFNCNCATGPYLVSFTYGKKPQDWKLNWDIWAEEFAGDFHEMVENQRYKVPGAWVDD